jgi:pyruvate dehydrogenase E2 component (dihydrolipoamide acetyltransferase)
MAFECQDDLYIAKILVAESTEVAVGGPIIVTVENESDVAAFKDFTLDMIKVEPTVAAAPAAPEVSSNSGSIASVTSSGEPVFVDLSTRRLSPAAAHMARSKGIALDNVVGTSRGGRISKGDLILALKSGVASAGSAPTANAHAGHHTVLDNVSGSVMDLDSFYSGLVPVNNNFTDIPNSNMRKVIARRLTESKATVPHLYAQIECRLDNLLAMRKTFATDLSTNVSVNDMVIKAAALALRDLPDVRRKWNPASNSVSEPDSVDIAVAVATPNGLITPIVTNADRRGCADINAAVKDLAGRAKVGKLMPEEYQGGSFSISNLGMFGISSFSAVINPPQACILAVGAGLQRAIPPALGESEPSVGTFLNVQLSADRRVVDEALAATFLEVFRKYLSNPKNLLL